MRRLSARSFRSRIVAALFGMLFVVCFASAEISPTNRPFPCIAYYSETRTNLPTRLFVAEVDLNNPNVRLRVSPGGPDPDGPGPWQTTLMPPTRIAEREGFDLVVNGDFFRARGINNAEGTNSTFRSEAWGAVNGPAATHGKTWSTSTNRWPCLVVHPKRKVTIELKNRPKKNDLEVLAGNTLLVENSVPVTHTNKVRHPRTAVGLAGNGRKLILLVVDGRKPGVAEGMNYDELAVELIRLGCRKAMNLDGGGSSVMAVRDPTTREFLILNTPTDGHERAVANVLGVSVQSAAP